MMDTSDEWVQERTGIKKEGGLIPQLEITPRLWE